MKKMIKNNHNYSELTSTAPKIISNDQPNNNNIKTNYNKAYNNTFKQTSTEEGIDINSSLDNSTATLINKIEAPKRHEQEKERAIIIVDTS